MSMYNIMQDNSEFASTLIRLLPNMNKIKTIIHYHEQNHIITNKKMSACVHTLC